MADIHKEFKFCLTHLLGMDMLLKSELFLHSSVAESDVFPQEETSKCKIDAISPPRLPPRMMYNDSEDRFP